MIDVSEEFKSAFLNGEQKSLSLAFSDGTTLTDDDIVAESLSITQTLCSEEQLVFGITSAAEFSVSIYNTGKRYKGLYVTPTITASDGETSMSLGTYLIYEDVRSDDLSSRALTAYDPLYEVINADYTEWYTSLSSMTFKEFRDAFFNHVGITQEEFELPTDSITINIKADESSISGATIIQGICEPNAAFGFINFDGNFQYVMPSLGGRHFPSDDIYPSDEFYPADGADIVFSTSDTETASVLGEFIYSDYYTHKITQARFDYTENTWEVVSGESGNCYRFEDNVLYYGLSEETLTAICNSFLDIVQGFFYVPASVRGRSRLWAQPGDMVNVITTNDTALFPILTRTISGITALYDTYEAQGTEYYTYSVNSYYTKMTNAETRSSEIETEVEEISETTGELKVSLQRTESGLESEVSRATSAESALSSRITQTESNITLKVSKGDVSSQLSVESGAITIGTGRLTIDADNFKLDTDGNAIATNFLANLSLGIQGSGDYYLYITAGRGQVMFGTSPYGTNAKVVCGDASLSGDLLVVGSTSCNSIKTGTATITSSATVGGATVATTNQVWTTNASVYATFETFDKIVNGGFSLSNSGGNKALFGATVGAVFSMVAASDERLKQNIDDVTEDYVSFYNDLKPKRFNYKQGAQPGGTDNNGQWFGFIAQEVQQTANEHCINPYGFVTDRESFADSVQEMYCGNSYKTMNYSNFHALHVMMIQRHEKRIAELETENADLKARLDALEKIVLKGETNAD